MKKTNFLICVLIFVIPFCFSSCLQQKQIPAGYKYFNWGMSMSEVEEAIDDSFDDGYFTSMDKTEDTLTYDVFDNQDPLFVGSAVEGQFYDATFSFKKGKLVRIEMTPQSECSMDEFDLAVEELKQKFGEPSINKIDADDLSVGTYATFDSDNSRINVLIVSLTSHLTVAYTKNGEYLLK